MCELLGLAFNRPVSPGLSFRGFRHRSSRNRDGWGLAAIRSGRAVIVKEPIRADRSDRAEAVRDDATLAAPIFIGHVRAASRGEVSLRNTHPFRRRIDGRDFVFAHNGTLHKPALARHVADGFTIEGETDSEMAMGALLSWLERERIGLGEYGQIEQFLRDLNDAGDLNLLFSDGHRLYAYHDAQGFKSLHWTHRRAPFPRIALVDEDWEANLGEEKHPDQRGYVIATAPLTEGEDWTPLMPGTMAVFDEGDMVYGG